MSKDLASSPNDAYQDDDMSSIDIGIYEVLLPCRRYRITFKVAEVGKVSLTTEFLLRLIHTVDGMPETAVSKFFSFEPQEMTYLLNDAVSLGYISRSAGRLWLTTAGRQLFVPWDESPQIYNVDTRTMSVGFDMLSFSPEEKTWMENFDNRLPELPIDPLVAGNAKERIPTSFKHHFNDLTSRRQSRYDARKTLYSIDEVIPTERYTAIIPIVVKSLRSNPAQGEPNLLVWRSEEQLENRHQITSAVARFVDELRMDLPPDADLHYKILADLAPDLMRDYIGKEGGVSAERFYRDVALLKGAGFRRNRRTVPILGPLISTKTTRLILDGLSRTSANSQINCIPQKFYWRAPSNRHWGLSRSLPKLCEGISEYLATKIGEDVPRLVSVLVREERTRGPERAFSEVQETKVNSLPSSLEIILVPGLLVAAVVNLPIQAMSGHAVPLGFISIEEKVIARAEQLLQEVTPIELPKERITEDMIDFPEH
ncbi:hypothetical protein FMK90_24310 [Klebsiella grimontii]|uniref:hypothetical protein n=1 Tax=Klebsiella grimontii TaxID=2058152 RepID=UPI001CCEEDD5|nr:hypothetical protein [Klebsiella grimontii]MBZ7367934.1 hypothetical protein [Klebsiella grimontii]